MDYLDSLSVSSTSESFSSLVSDVQSLYSRKLWYQLSVRLFDLLQQPALQSTESLLRFYHSFLSKLTGKIKTFSLVKLAVLVSRSLPSPGESIKFLEALETSIPAKERAADQESAVFLRLEILRRKIANGEVDSVKSGLDESRSQLDGATEVMSPEVYSLLYLALCEYHKLKGTPNEYYQNSILYLSYTPLASMEEKQQVQFSSDLCLSAILGANIYNFGELLQQPILKSLESQSQLSWLPQLLKAFNHGDINEFQKIFNSIKSNQPLMAMNQEFLNQKIRILAFVELAFSRPVGQRSFQFQSIAAHCQIPSDQVEWLIMKALALGVVKGTIDQVNETVTLNWIQPRVLDQQQIKGIKAKLAEWRQQVDQATIFVENNAQQITGH